MLFQERAHVLNEGVSAAAKRVLEHLYERAVTRQEDRRDRETTRVRDLKPEQGLTRPRNARNNCE